LAWAGATALALALVLFLHHRAVEAQRAESAARLSALAKGWLQGSTNWPDTQRLLQMSQALDRPLETELQGVVQDATATARQLALNFLPNLPPRPDR
jgi:hypothetical protein